MMTNQMAVSKLHEYQTKQIPMPTALSLFQKDFGGYVRAQPSLINENHRTHLYQTLVNNTISGFVNQCFPICRQIIQAHYSELIWRELIKSFIACQPLNSPYFSEINEQFVAYLSSEGLAKFGLPKFLGEFAHYEWIELYVDNLPNNKNHLFFKNKSAFFINHSVQILYYEWAVHEISINNLPTQKSQSFLLVFRHNIHDKIEFMVINKLSFIVLNFIQNQAHEDIVYDNKNNLLADLKICFGLNDDIMAIISSSFDELFKKMLDHGVFILID